MSVQAGSDHGKSWTGESNGGNANNAFRRDSSNDSNYLSTDTSFSERQETVASNRNSLPHKGSAYSEPISESQQIATSRDWNSSRQTITSSSVLPSRSHFYRRSDSDYGGIEWDFIGTTLGQKLSYLLIIITFICNLTAVCTPNWVVGWEKNQIILKEGIWQSCYVQARTNQWTCSTYDYIRKQLQLPVWYQATQVLAVLGLLLLLPGLMTATVSYCISNLKGSTQANWLHTAILGSSLCCSFFSVLLYGSCYPQTQTIPRGVIRFHFSYGFQIVGILILFLALVAHVRDALPTLKVWANQDHERTKDVTDYRNPAQRTRKSYSRPKLPSITEKFFGFMSSSENETAEASGGGNRILNTRLQYPRKPSDVLESTLDVSTSGLSSVFEISSQAPSAGWNSQV